jgi:ABC-type multidrug transport system ATPase subunit
MLRIQALQKDFLHRRGLRELVRPCRRRVLAGVDLHLSSGEIVALFGANGSGKTTLLKIIAGLLAPTGGTIAGAGEAGRVGITTADSRSFYWRLSCRANLQFFGALQRVPPGELPRRIDDVAQRMGIGDRLDDPFMTLSSGQMQRLALVRTLIGEPHIWLLDEATRSLDESGRALVRHELGRLQDRGGVALWASHDEAQTAAVCTRSVRLVQGRLLEVGP